MPRTIPKTLKIVRRKLAQKGKRYYGRAFLNDGKARITVDPVKNNTSRELMNTLVHEAVHLGDWLADREKDLTEREIDIISRNVVNVLWREGYRKVQIR